MTNVRSVTVRLNADVAAYIAQMQAAGKATEAAFRNASTGDLDRDLRVTSTSARELGNTSRATAADVDRLGNSTRATARDLKSYSLAQALAEEQASRHRSALRAQAKEMLDLLPAADASTDALNRNTDAVDLNDRAFSRSGRDLDSYTARLGLLAQTAGALGPSLGPLGAVAVGGVMALGNALGFAAASAAVAVGAFQGVGTALKAVDTAVLQPTAENLQKARDAMQQLSPAARDMVRELHGLEPVLKGLRAAGAEALFPGVIRGMDELTRLAPQVERIMTQIGGAMGDLFRAGAEDLTSVRWAGFFDMLEHEARPTMESLGHAVGSVAHGLGELWVAFTPLNRTFNGWLEDAARGFDDWATGLSKTRGFHEFVDYVRANGPRVGEAIGAIANAILQIAEAAAPLGGPVLQGVTALADAIADIADSPLGLPIMAWVTGMSTLGLAAKGTAAAMKVLKIESAGAVSAMGGLQGVAIVVGLQQIAENADKLKTSWAEFKQEFSDGEFNSNTVEDLASGLFNQIPVIGSVFDASTDAVHRFGDMIGVQTRTTEHFLGPIVAATQGTQGFATALGRAQTHADKLNFRLQQQRLEAREQAAAIRQSAQGFYTLADAVKKPELSLADLETRMRRQTAVTEQMARDMQTAIKKGVDPRAVQQMWDELGNGASGAMHELATGSQAVRDQFNRTFRDSQGAVHSLNAVLEHLADAIDRLAGKKAKPKLDLDDAAFNRKAELGHHTIDNLGRQHADPKVNLDGVEVAIAQANTLRGAIGSLHDKTLHITTFYNTVRGGAVSSAGGHEAPVQNATGGYIRGPGTTTSDSIPALLSDREYVVRAAAVDHYGVDFFHRANAMRLAAGGSPAYGNGGGLGSSPTLSWTSLASPLSILGRVGDEAGHLIHEFHALSESAAQWHGTSGELFQELHEGTITQRDIRRIELQDRKRHLEHLQQLQQKELDATKARLEAELQYRQQFEQAIRDRFAVDTGQGSGSWQLVNGELQFVEGPATFESIMDQFDTSSSDAQQFTALELQLKHLLKQAGVGGKRGQKALEWLLENYGVDTLQSFASQSPDALAQFVGAFATNNQILGNAGDVGAAVTGMNALVAQLRDQKREEVGELRDIKQHIKQLTSRMDNLDKTGPERTGKAVGRALNGTASRAFDEARRPG